MGGPDRSIAVFSSPPYCDNGDRPGIPGYAVLNVEAAVLDTEDKWRLFKTLLIQAYGQERGERIACAIRSDGPVRTCPAPAG